MSRRIQMVLLIIAVLSVPLLGADKISVLPPNGTGYSVDELASIQQAIVTLADILNDYSFGSYRYFDPSEWMSSDFSAYTAGILASDGYVTQLVRQDGWPDGTHTWVLVGIPVSSGTAWIPVEASPTLGKRQSYLGSIPTYVDTEGTLWFDAAYTTFQAEVSLPKNIPPIVSIRVVPTQSIVGQDVTFMALASYDPDGEMVHYDWDIAGLETSHASTVRTAFQTAGTYTITLVGTDSRGAATTASIDFQVRNPGQPVPASASGGCGCHSGS